MGSENLWRTLDTGVREFALLANGSLYALNDRGEFRRLREGRTWAMIASDVTSFAQVDQTIYTLHQSGQLRRMVNGNWSRVGAALESFTVAFDGTLYALNRQNVLSRLETSGSWTMLQPHVRTYQVTQFGFLYVLTEQQELRRLKFGYSWSTLQSGGTAFQIHDYGTVYVQDSLNRVTMYASHFPHSALEPIDTSLPHYALDLPSPHDVVEAAGFGGPGGGGWIGRTYCRTMCSTFPQDQTKAIRFTPDLSTVPVPTPKLGTMSEWSLNIWWTPWIRPAFSRTLDGIKSIIRSTRPPSMGPH